MEHFEHNIGDHEDPVPASTWLVGALGAVLLVVIVFGLTALYYNARMVEADAKVLQRDSWELRRYDERQQRHFVREPAWVERVVVDQRVRAKVIPIEEAMDQVVREAQASR